MENVETSGTVMNVGMCHFSRPKWMQIQNLAEHAAIKKQQATTVNICWLVGLDLCHFFFNILVDCPSFHYSLTILS